MRKTNAVAFIFFIFLTAPVLAADPSASSQAPNVPDWLKRTNFGLQAQTDQKPQYFLETVQPLLGTQHNDVVLFNQTRITGQDDRSIYNLGFGLRKIFRGSYLLGVNSFYDYQDLHQHSRAGVGLEAMTDQGLEARLNSYIRVSRSRLVQEDAFNYHYERVANGFDWELGAPLPYLPFLKVYGGGNWYNFEHFYNKYGWQTRLEYTPTKYSRLDFIMLDDNKSSRMGYRFEGAITLAFTSFAWKDILKDIKGTHEAYPKVDLQDKVLDRVVRDNSITVIKSKKSKTTGLTVEGGRT